MQENRAVQEFLEKPTTYVIEVRDGNMFPGETPKEVTLTVPSPTMHTLAICAEILSEMPDELSNPETANLKDAVAYRGAICRILMTMASDGDDYPKHMEKFLERNLSTMELLYISKEIAAKANPAFFLTSIQLLKESNPMAGLDGTRGPS